MPPPPDFDALSGRVAAVILAGGKGARLGGVIKANLVIGGVRLLERVSAALSAVRGPVLVAHGAIEPALLNLLPGQVLVGDAEGFAGPLAGLAGAAAWCGAQAEPPELLVSVAVDTPFFPADFAQRAFEALSDDVNGVIASYAGQPYPTNALWRLSAFRGIGAASGGIRHFAESVRTRLLEWPVSTDGDPFANVNTPADRAELEARAAHTS